MSQDKTEAMRFKLQNTVSARWLMDLNIHVRINSEINRVLDSKDFGRMEKFLIKLEEFAACQSCTRYLNYLNRHIRDWDNEFDQKNVRFFNSEILENETNTTNVSDDIESEYNDTESTTIFISFISN